MLNIFSQYGKFADSFLKKLPQLPAIKKLKIRSVVYNAKVLSMNSPDVQTNELLELVGDGVLGLVVLDSIMKKHPYLTEGDLSHLKALLTNNNVLQHFAIAYNFHLTPQYKKALQISPSINNKILADMFEAYIGGVYKDNGSDGLPSVKRWIIPLISPLMEYYCNLYGYNKLKYPYLTRDIYTKVPVNPLSAFVKEVDESVDHCSLVEPVDSEARNTLHILCDEANKRFLYKLVDNIPEDSPLNINKNGSDLKVSILVIDDVVCATGEGFSIQNSQSRCAMALLKSMNRLKRKGIKSGKHLKVIEDLLKNTDHEHFFKDSSSVKRK